MSVLCLLGVLAATPAQAQDTSAWDVLQRALLAEAAAGDYEFAIGEYERLVRNLAVDSPVRAEALFRLGSARHTLGDVAGAREALLEGIRTGTCRVPCRVLLGRIQLDAESIREVPVSWSFDTAEHGVFHPWEFDDKGSIRVQDPSEAANPALIWETTVDVRRGDQLVVGFLHPTPAPRMIRFRMQASPNPASIHVRVVDDMKRAYGPASGAIRIGTDRPTLVEVALDDLVSVDPDDPALDPASIHRLYIHDVSAFNGTSAGPNALYVDDFSVE